MTDLLLRRSARHPLAAASLVVLAVLTAPALAVSWITNGIWPPNDFSDLMQGAPASLLIPLLGVAVSVVVGTSCGLVAGVYAGHFNSLVGWVAYVTASVPALIFLVVVMVDSSRSLTGAMVIFGALLTIPFFLLARSTVVSVEHRPTVHALRAQGLTAVRLLVRSVFPALRYPLLALVLIESSVLVSIHALLTFLGLGGETGPSWGAQAREALQNMPTTPPYSWGPSALLLLTVAALATLGLSILRAQRLLTPTGSPVRSADGEEQWLLDEPLPSTWFRSSALLDVRGLKIRSESNPESPEIVSGISLTIARGEVVALLGEANSGALEIALAIAGLLGPRTTISGGSILFDGIEVVGMTERSLSRLRGTGVSYLPSDPLSSLDPAFSVARHLQAPLTKTVGLSRSGAAARSVELLARVGFRDPRAILALRPADLTPIMAARVLIAGAISCDPHLVIAHEPTSTLSGADEADILRLLHGLQEERGLTVIVVTHRVRLLAASCRQVAVVQAGMIVEHASVSDLFDAPQHPYTRELLSRDASR
ncbi:ATP-binding cassette domain-containing protein [Cryobacterium roopkundense]|uniref:Peptide/nickel transport system permease protein n=1 Tax=Cryobacterium roopkundense TaxID=1001240 RepID=A0A7W8ZYR7_9MICO|nr:ATP-binding cassette domain-containing protein [Cryobacterium roopkundense]MBB5642709.1 peptide/nickel transport system permease protein [Cryobacterium roopkundense]